MMNRITEPLKDEWQLFMKHLLKSDKKAASDLILNTAEKGISIIDIYKYIIQKSQYEIGRLWQMNIISVAQEHYCTAVTQMIMSQLYPYIFSTEKNGYTLVATCVAGELHELGIRMVADIFELMGWDTYFLGANTPLSSIVETLKSRDADVLAVSASMTFNVGKVKELIGQVKSVEDLKNVKIIVGGRPFNISGELWKKVNADGFGSDAEASVETANRIIKGH